jgi:hypothetical protein
MNSENEKIGSLKKRLLEINAQRDQILHELKLAGSEVMEAVPALGKPAAEKKPGTPKEKVDLFLSLFRCRESVYPKLWENPKKGIKGYAPACNNEWINGICEKPRIKCTECTHQNSIKLINRESQYLENIWDQGTACLTNGNYWNSKIWFQV